MLLIILSLYFISLAFTHQCGHDLHMKIVYEREKKGTPIAVTARQDYVVPGPGSVGVNDEPPPLFTQPLRLGVNFDNLYDDVYTCYKAGDIVNSTDPRVGTHVCRPEDVLTKEKKDLLVTLLSEAVEYFQEYLLVIPLSGNLIINSSLIAQQSCDGVNIDYSYESIGVPNVQYMLFVTSRPCIQDTTLAYARYCQFDVSSYGYYRPIAGVVNFGPFGIDPSAESRPMQRGLVIHELTHALGFMFATFSQGFTQWTWHNITGWTPSHVKNVTTSYFSPEIGHYVTRITTPYTRDAVREHYGCPDLDGAELENGGGNETTGSHWEQRVFMNEYMTGTATPYPVYSNVTFSLFKDMGWYGVSPNISNLEPFLWGHKMGCSFVNGACKNWPLTTEKEGYRCDDTTPRGQCRFDFKGWAQCNRDFPDPLDDGCLFYKSTVRTGCDIDSTLFQLTLDAGQEHSTDSLCFHSSAARLPGAVNSFVRFPQGNSMQCYYTTCSSPQNLKVRVEGIWYDCPYAGGYINPVNFGGVINCEPQMADVACVGYNDSSDEWPVVLRIDPREANPGDIVTIYGSNFKQNITWVKIHDNCTIIAINSPNQLVVQLPPSESFSSIEALGLYFGRFTVVVGDDLGRNSHLIEGIRIYVPANGASINYFFKDRLSIPSLVLSIVSSLLVAILIGAGIFWCYKIFPKKTERKITYQTVSLK